MGGSDLTGRGRLEGAGSSWGGEAGLPGGSGSAQIDAVMPCGSGDAEWFRAHGHRVVDWIADYLDGRERYPVLSRARPGEVREALPVAPPSEPEDMAVILDDFERVVIPGITHWNHPGFMAYFAITGSPPGILGEMLAAALNVNGMLWRTSPAATELEQLTLDWLRQMLGLPEAFAGVITDTASISSLLAIAAAREATGRDVRRLGMAGRADLPPLSVYCSEHAHASIEKAAITLGIGHEGVRKVAVDGSFRMSPDALLRQVREDRAAGRLPFCVVATVGTTSTTSIDPVPAVADICREEDLWLHVDGAYGGMAAIVPEMRQVLAGCDAADSLVVNPHKWLQTPVDCSALYVRDPEMLRRAFGLVPEYLRTDDGDPAVVTNYMDWGVQLGRRFRALKLWFVIRAHGVDGLSSTIRRHCELARRFAAWVDDAQDWVRVAPVPFSVVCFRYAPDGVPDQRRVDAMAAAILDRVNRSGEVLLSHTRLDGRLVLRLAVGHAATTDRHVARAWALLRAAAEAERRSSGESL